MSMPSEALGQQAALQRIRKVFSVGLLANVLTLLSSFLIPPLFLQAIGAERYGQWLYLFSIPTSLAMLDLGVSAAFSTEVYKHQVEGRADLAALSFKTGLKVIGALMGGAFMLASAVIAWRHARQGDLEVHATVWLLCAYVLVGFVSELMSSAFKVAGQYHRFQWLGLITRAAEIGSMLLLIAYDHFVWLAASMLLIRVSSLAWTAWRCSRLLPGLWQGSWAGMAPWRHLMLPSLMYAVNPLIMFIALQVPLLLIGPSAGMAAVVAYTTMRTLARLPLQISSQVSFSLYTEYTRLHAQGDAAMVGKLYRKGQWLILGLFAAHALGGLVLGEWVYELWLKQVPQAFHTVFLFLLLDACLESFMRHKVCLSSATNQHARDTLLHLGLVCASAAGLWFLTSTQGGGLSEVMWLSAVVAVVGLLGLAWGARRVAKQNR